MIHHKDLSYKPKFIVYIKTFWIFHKQFVACDEVYGTQDDNIVLCKIEGEVVAILDRKLFKYAKRINYAS